MKYAVNRLITSPQKSVTAKPLIGPVPNWKSITAVIIEVTCESIMVVSALL